MAALSAWLATTKASTGIPAKTLWQQAAQRPSVQFSLTAMVQARMTLSLFNDVWAEAGNRGCSGYRGAMCWSHASF